jgi:hypothetical protein
LAQRGWSTDDFEIMRETESGARKQESGAGKIVAGYMECGIRIGE